MLTSMVVCYKANHDEGQAIKYSADENGTETSQNHRAASLHDCPRPDYQGRNNAGTRISEKEISDVLGVSRQPVREAFIKLREENLVEVRPQRGTFASKINLDAVNDARFIREAVEADIVKLLVVQGDPVMIERLREMIAAQKALIDGPESETFTELDDRFHRSLAEFAGKNTAWDVIARMKTHFDRVRYLSANKKPLNRLVDQHEAVVDAIAAKDVVKAEQAIRFHLREVIRDLPGIVERVPDYFTNP